MYDDEDCSGAFELADPGRHNVLNALAALSQRAGARRSGAGTWRRARDVRGRRAPLPASRRERAALSWSTTTRTTRGGRARRWPRRAPRIPERRLVVAFQPHLFSRTRDFAREFGGARWPRRCGLSDRDLSGARAADCRRDVGARGRRAWSPPAERCAWRGERRRSPTRWPPTVRDGDVVLTMGAGDITKTGPELLARARR